MCKLTPIFHNAYPEETGAAVMKSHFSLHVKATYQRHFAWSHKHKNRNEISLDPTRNSLRSISISQVDIFDINITRWALYFTQGGRMGYPVWYIDHGMYTNICHRPGKKAMSINCSILWRLMVINIWRPRPFLRENFQINFLVWNVLCLY